MANLLNPLDWLQGAQDWFVRSERSSGFRPYLIYLILCFGFSLVLLILFPESEVILFLAAGVIIVVVIGFFLVYCVKAFQDPDFCRSETHVQKMKRIELETLGSEDRAIEAEVLEQQLLDRATKETRALEDERDTEERS